MTTIARFIGLTEAELADPELDAALVTRQYKRGELILRPHDPATHIYCIDSGLVKVYTSNAQAQELIHILYGPGELFPLTQIVDSKEQLVYFEAINDCEITSIPKALFDKLVQTNSAFSYAVIKKIMNQFTVYVSRVNNLELKYGRERLAYRLLLLAGRFGTTKNNQITIPLLNQHDLGAMINVSRENVNRELVRFEKLGLIKRDHSHLLILDSNGLHRELGKDVNVMFFDKPTSSD